MQELGPDNPCDFQLIIENYEALFKELHEELCDVKNSHTILKDQLALVLTENNKLSKEHQNLLAITKTPGDDIENTDLVHNLRQQLQSLQTEKDYVTKLWKEGVRTIDILEDELKIYQAGTQNLVPKTELNKLKRHYEATISELKENLTQTEQKLQQHIKTASDKIETNHNQIDQSLENQAGALKIVKNLEAEVLKLQKRLEETVEAKIKLEKSLGSKENTIQGLKKANGDYLNKISEAVGLVEAALNEKDAALFRERNTKEENEKLVEEMTEIVKETQEKIQKETSKIREEFHEKEKQLLQDFNQAQNEIKIKQGEIEALTKQCHLMEKEIERMHKGHSNIEENDINKLLVLEKNLESTFQKLLLSEKQTIQLTSERELLKSDLDQMADLYDRNLKAKEAEISTLKSKINRLEMELNTSYEKVNEITDKMSKINEQISMTEKEFRNQKEINEAKYEQKLNELTKKYQQNLKDMQEQVELKTEINHKWRKETKNITENMEKLVTSLKMEIHTVKKDNRSLKESLKKSEAKVKQYKVFLELISKDVNKISNLTFGN